MSYEKQNFVKGQILKADHLNHMEDGIAAAAVGVQGPKGDKGDVGPQGPKGDKGDTGPAVALDPTLSVSGKAADAKATGDAIGELKEDFKNQNKVLNGRIYIHSKLNAYTTGGSIDTLYNGKANETYKIKLLNIDNTNWNSNVIYLFHKDDTFDTVFGSFHKIGDEVEFVAPSDFVKFRVFFTYNDIFQQDCYVYFSFEPKAEGLDSLKENVANLKEDFENQNNALNERIYIHSKLNADTQGGSIDTLYNGKANETYKIKLLNIDNSNWAGNAIYLFHADNTYDTISSYFNKIGDEVEFVAPSDFVKFRVFFTYNDIFQQDCYVYFSFEPKAEGLVKDIAKLKNDINELKKPFKNYKAMGILGDSYSTFEGWIPTGDGVTSLSNETFYPQGEITKVSQTWWHLLCNKLNCTLLKNESWSGATIAVGEYPVTSFVKRAEKTFGSDSTLKPKPDILFVFGGTNDMWQSIDKGTVKYSDWTDDDLKKSLPALCYTFDLLKTYNPGTYIVFVMNTVSVISDSNFRNGITDACEHYGIKLIKITGLSQLVNIHPQISEMQEICNQIYDGLVN